MASTTLVIGVLLDVLTAAMLTFVGLRVSALRDAPPALARSLWFWYGASVFMLLDGGFGLLVVTVDVPLWVATAVLIIRRLAFAAGWFAFAGWLMALNGRLRMRAWWTFTAVVLGAIFVQTWLQGVSGYEIRPWSVALAARAPTPVWVNVLFGAALFVPAAWEAVRLLARSRTMAPVPRYRARAIGGSILLFCALVLVGFVDNQWFLYGLLENRSLFAVGTGMLVALRPPRWLRTRGIPPMTSAHELPQLRREP